MLVLSALWAIYRKKDLKKIGEAQIKGLLLFAIAFLLQFLFHGLILIAVNAQVTQWLRWIYPWVHMFSYQLILIGILLDIEKSYMKVFFLGAMMNFIVILANGMKMPVYLPIDHVNYASSYAYLATGNDLVHTLMTESTRIKWLGDIIMSRSRYPIEKSISIGDIFLVIGFGWFIQEESR